MKNKNLKLSGMTLAGIIIIVSFAYAINVQPVVIGNLTLKNMLTEDLTPHSYQLMSFSSYEEFTDFLENCSSGRSDGYHYYTKGLGIPNIMIASIDVDFAEEGTSVDFSETNIQVEGVDEPDVVKTDGKYLYLVSGQKVYIIKAWPADEAKVVANISVNFSISNIFINGDRLIIFGNSYDYYIFDTEDYNQTCLPYPWYSSSNTYIKVYDVTDRGQPELKRDVVIGGNYFNARMIGDHVYVITRQYSYNIRPCYENNDTIIPLISINGEVKKIPLSDIYCIDIPSYGYTLTHVVSVNVKDDSEDIVDKIFTLGSGQTMYVSKNNIYITYPTSRSDYYIMQEIIDEVVMPLLPDEIKIDILNARSFNIPDDNKRQIVDWILDDYYKTLDEELKNNIQAEIQEHIYRTMIHKISVRDGKIKYMCNGTVPGSVLNQFSMDEHKGFFRVATQINGYWQSNSKRTTNVYILDGNLNRVGEVENIAPGENLHSARFMGDRAYLVTFKKVDPFFTLDLSDPYNPKVLGKLKIPGYSDYLHPYDENHIIGIGKDTVESGNSRFAWYQGLKIALFDVSDFENPKEVAKVIIGDRGTDSPVLYNHKAFLFNREKELMVIPVRLCEISDEIKEQNDGYTGSIRGEFTFQGAYVYKLNLDEFEYKGRITHMDEEDFAESGYYGYWGDSAVSRSLYIEDVLYTISDNMVKMNSLDDLSEINSVKLE